MEFPFITTKPLNSDQHGFAILFPRRNRAGQNDRFKTSSLFDDKADPVDQIIDRMGKASAQAQKLAQVITTATRFYSSGDNRIYIKAEGKQVIGFLKTGARTLFQRIEGGDIKEIKPICVLDFYVHENVQRGGYGK